MRDVEYNRGRVLKYLAWPVAIAWALQFAAAPLYRANRALGQLVLAAMMFVPALGVLLAVKGVLALLGALGAKKKNLFSILFALLTVVVGVMLIVSKWAMMDTLFLVIGVLLIVDGAMSLIGAR